MELSCHFVFPNVELFLVFHRLYFCVITAAYYVTFSVHENAFTGFILESVILIIYFIVELSRYVYKLCGQLILDITVGVC